MKKKIKIIISLFAIGLLLFSPFIFIVTREMKATIKTNKLQTGDTFKVVSKYKDPFKDPYIFGGKIIAKQGEYIQYVNDYGDTCSMNIHTYYLRPKVDSVIVMKSFETCQ
jgi:hypothetical protein